MISAQRTPSSPDISSNSPSVHLRLARNDILDVVMARSSPRHPVSSSRDIRVPSTLTISVSETASNNTKDEPAQWRLSAVNRSTTMSASQFRNAEKILAVPDPPSWSRQAPTEAEDSLTTRLPASAQRTERRQPKEMQRRQTVLSGPSRVINNSKAAASRYLPSPPPTPTISRLDTPDLEPLVKADRFCLCCPRDEAEALSESYRAGRVKMDSQRMSLNPSLVALRLS